MTASDVQLAVVVSRLEAIRENIEILRNDIREMRADLGVRLADHEQRIRVNERAVTRSTGFLAGLQLLIGALAAYIGSKF